MKTKESVFSVFLQSGVVVGHPAVGSSFLPKSSSQWKVNQLDADLTVELSRTEDTGVT